MGGRAVLVVSRGLVHPSARARSAFAAIVRGADMDAEFSASTRAFRTLVPDRHAAAVAFLHSKRIETADLDALEAFVAAGGGLFAVHGALASFKGEPRWAALLGASFAGHERPTLLAIAPSAEPGPFAGIPTFGVGDELYRVTAAGAIAPRFTAIVARGGSPAATVVWTRTHGRGRVCCCALGHAAAVFQQSSVRQIIARALAWVSRSEEAIDGA